MDSVSPLNSAAQSDILAFEEVMLLDQTIRSSIFADSRPTIADLERKIRACYVNQDPLLTRQ
jgi:hypothetical protein